MAKRIHRTLADTGRNHRAKTFSLTIDLDNAAFDDNPRLELGAILQAIAVHIHEGNTGRAIDTNGNTVGHWVIA